MAAKLIINEDPETLIRDIAEGFVKGNHTLCEFLDLLYTVGEKMEAKR